MPASKEKSPGAPTRRARKPTATPLKAARGRPTFKPTDENRKMVEAMAAYGVREDEIADIMDIDPKTLRKHFRRELDLGHIKANVKVAESLYQTAIKGGREGVTAAIFWLKTRAGWSEYMSPPAPPPRPPKEAKIGKKEAALQAARNPDKSTSMGELMARRVAGKVH
ncbi:hypothetical protein [Ancylobacter defluvii]|uniref:Uncharacterized protein n=1 Tax=Ancylobacter defluvii TaxID=1282440 RepID=A0A9W6K392_9HYPH|nr:hypothetical protein [Ancylobacter defluvii]MBS7588278.1 hypothetical protein [Ancylobacter defluvii]GLK86674.1 hypothetical protein GCM10017653_47440 [Ancylobacter defluvii]